MGIGIVHSVLLNSYQNNHLALNTLTNPQATLSFQSLDPYRPTTSILKLFAAPNSANDTYVSAMYWLTVAKVLNTAGSANGPGCVGRVILKYKYIPVTARLTRRVKHITKVGRISGMCTILLSKYPEANRKIQNPKILTGKSYRRLLIR